MCFMPCCSLMQPMLGRISFGGALDVGIDALAPDGALGLPVGSNGPIELNRRIVDILAAAIGTHPAVKGLTERQCRDVAQTAIWALENNKYRIADSAE